MQGLLNPCFVRTNWLPRQEPINFDNKCQIARLQIEIMLNSEISTLFEWGGKMIHGVRTKLLRVIPDERGRVMEILRADDDLFLKFGQVYITTTYPQVVKAWHYHKVQTDHICAIQGMIKLVLYDPREGSPTKGEINEFFIGVHNPLLVQVPQRDLSWMEMHQRGGSDHHQHPNRGLCLQRTG